MAGKKHGNGSILKDIGFVLGALLLLGCLGGIYYLHTLQNQKEEEKLQAIIANEQAPGINSSKILSDVIEETTQTSGTEEAGGAGGAGGAAGASVNTEPMPDQHSETAAQSGSEAPAEGAESQPEAEAAAEEDIKDASILVLNGSYRDGVAAYWEQRLTEAGYQHLYTGSYSGQAEEKTVIYASSVQKAEVFKEIFADAEIREGEPAAAYTLNGTAPETSDYIIVIGKGVDSVIS